MKLFIFLFSILTFSCIPVSENKKSFDSLQYYTLIDKAENYIIENDYVKANDVYNDTYLTNGDMYGIDLYNALLCNLYLKKWNNCEIWSVRLINKGVKIDFFKSNRFTEFRKTSAWLNVEKKYLKTKPTLNKSLIEQLDSLLAEDQKEYCLIPSGDISYDDAKKTTETIDSKLLKLMTQNGYPSENLIGLNTINDTIIGIIPKYSALLRHSYQANNDSIMHFINKSIEQGEMDKRVAKALFDDSYYFVVYKDNLYKKKAINPNENLAEEKKLIFKSKNKGFIFFSKYVVYDSETSDIDMNEFLKEYSFISKWNNKQE